MTLGNVRGCPQSGYLRQGSLPYTVWTLPGAARAQRHGDFNPQRYHSWLALFLLIGLGLASSLSSLSSAATWVADPAANPGGDGSAQSPFLSLATAVAAASAGDTLQLREGHFVQSHPVSIGGDARRAVLPLKPGLIVRGAGRGRTILEAPAVEPPTFGITLQGGGPESQLSDLTVQGPCWIGVYLWDSDVHLENLELRTDIVDGSSTAFDARESSFPTVMGCRFDGGHNGIFVEFESGGSFVDCTVTARPREGLVVIDSTPLLERCVIEGSGRDTVVLTQGSQPILRDCELGEGARWTLRIDGYPVSTTVDLSGNLWFSREPSAIAASIFDAQDDPSLGATVLFMPLADPVSSQQHSMGRLKLEYEAEGSP